MDGWKRLEQAGGDIGTGAAVTRDDDDRDVPERRVAPLLLTELLAVEDRHPHVQLDEVGLVRRACFLHHRQQHVA